MPYFTLHHVLNLSFINDDVTAIHCYRSHGSKYSALALLHGNNVWNTLLSKTTYSAFEVSH